MPEFNDKPRPTIVIPFELGNRLAWEIILRRKGPSPELRAELDAEILRQLKLLYPDKKWEGPSVATFEVADDFTRATVRRPGVSRPEPLDCGAKFEPLRVDPAQAEEVRKMMRDIEHAMIGPFAIVEAGVGPGHPKTECSWCGVRFGPDDEAIATCTATEYVTLCRSCYDKAGNNVR